MTVKRPGNFYTGAQSLLGLEFASTNEFSSRKGLAACMKQILKFTSQAHAQNLNSSKTCKSSGALSAQRMLRLSEQPSCSPHVASVHERVGRLLLRKSAWAPAGRPHVGSGRRACLEGSRVSHAAGALGMKRRVQHPVRGLLELLKQSSHQVMDRLHMFGLTLVSCV